MNKTVKRIFPAILGVIGCLNVYGAENRLPNSDFAVRELSGTPTGWELHGAVEKFSFDSGIAALSNVGNAEPLLLIRRGLPVTAAAPWAVSFQVAGDPGAHFTAYVEWTLPGDGEVIWRNAIVERREAGSDWERIVIPFIPEAGFQDMKLVLRAEPGATVMFAALSLAPAPAAAPVEIPPSAWRPLDIAEVAVRGEGVCGRIRGSTGSLTAPVGPQPIAAADYPVLSFGLTLPAGAADRIRFAWRRVGSAEFAAADAVEIPVVASGESRYYRFDLSVRSEWNGKIEAIRIVPAVDPVRPEVSFQLDNVQLSSGVADRVIEDAEAVFRFDPAALAPQAADYPPEMFNSAGALLIDGEPQFLLSAAPPMVPDFLIEMDRAGFNHIDFIESLPPEWVCRELAQTRLRLMAYIPPAAHEDDAAYRERADRILSRLGAFRALLIYYFNIDEPTWRQVPLEQVAQLYRVMASLSPRRPVMLTHAPRNTVAELTPFSRQSDIVCVDIYPVPVGYHSELPNKTLSCVGEYADKTRATATPQQPLWMWLQAYSRGGYPDFHQTRFMAYNAIMHGAMGILYYGTNHLPFPDNPMWPVLKKFGPELRGLNRVLTAPWQGPLESSSGVELRIKKVDGEWYWFVANTLDARRTLRLELPGVTRLHADFDGRILTPAEGVFRDELEPFGVRVYSTAPLTIPEIHSGLAASELTVLLEGPGYYIWQDKNRRNCGRIVYFRKRFELDALPQEAGMVVSGDDGYSLYCNGKLVGEDREFSRGGKFMLSYYDLKPYLAAGPNVLAVASSHNTGNAALYAEIRLDDRVIVSDTSWRCSDVAVDGWNTPEFDDADWETASSYDRLGGSAMDYYFRYFMIRKCDRKALDRLRRLETAPPER